MKRNPEKIALPVTFEKAPKEEIPLIAFLFGPKGKLISTAPVRDNRAELNSAGLDTRQLRLFIAPAYNNSIQQVTTIQGLSQYKPYEAVLSSNADGTLKILPIPVNIARFWPLCQCRVTGNVSKWFNINDVSQDRAICQARVHICNVDFILYWIYRIPDYIILKIPPVILNPGVVIHPPIPDPGPIELQAAFSSAPTASDAFFNTVSKTQAKEDLAQSLPVISDEIKQKLSSNNVNVIRETIVKYYPILHPFFCLRPWWWPWLYRTYELTEVYTDNNGNFDTDVYYFCDGGRPDIYIWVECLINNVWTTVYNPPIPCNTYWNYVCGTPINIQITDPRVQWGCNEIISGEIVWIKTIGESASVTHICQNSVLASPPGQSKQFNQIGLTDASVIGDPGFWSFNPGNYQRPFGGQLSLLLQFGSDLPANGMYYYRWSYMQTKNADLSGASDSWHQISGGISKGYTYEYTDGTGTHFGSNACLLGPTTVGSNNNLYIIPPPNPADAPFNVTDNSPYWDQNTWSAVLDTTGLANGLYQFKLELFDQSGNLLSGIPANVFQVPDYNAFSPSVNAPSSLLLGYDNPVTPTIADAYTMLVRIDNSKCQSGVFTIDVNGSPSSSDCCGFVSYKPGGVESEDIGLSFLASQPNNFAVFQFTVAKGTCGDVTDAGAVGMVIDSADGYTLDTSTGIYSESFTPSDLLGSCYDEGTGKAAFAEALSVCALSTDGTYRLSGYDGPFRLAGFALEP